MMFTYRNIEDGGRTIMNETLLSDFLHSPVGIPVHTIVKRAHNALRIGNRPTATKDRGSYDNYFFKSPSIPHFGSRPIVLMHLSYGFPRLL
jgi:hypothetical protein